jgi:4-amino-4-deoxy-L-arabinose transferase-like glycosyltransferase
MAISGAPFWVEGARARSRSTRNLLLWVLVAATVVRVAYAVGAWLVTRDLSVFIEQDTDSYLGPARDLLARGTFTVNGRPELQRTPGYPLLLMIGLTMGALIPVTIAIQVLLSVVTTLGVVVIANLVSGDRRAGIVAGALYAFEPISIDRTPAIATETLYTTFAVWGLALLVVYVRERRLPALLGGTSLLSVGTYVRPAGYYLPFGLMLFLAALVAVARDWRRLAQLGLAAAVAIAIVLPWHIRNRALGFQGFSAISAVNMYFYNAAAVEARRAGTSYADVQAAMGYRDGSVYLRLHPEQATWSPGRRFGYMGREGARVVEDNLALYARIHAEGMLRVLLDPGALSLLQPYGLYKGNSGVLSVIVTSGLVNGLRQILRTNVLGFALLVALGALLMASYVLAVRGWLSRARDPAVLLLVLAIAYFITIAGGPVAVGRFRHPAMPFVCVLAAIGLIASAIARRRVVGQNLDAVPVGLTRSAS